MRSRVLCQRFCVTNTGAEYDHSVNASWLMNDTPPALIGARLTFSYCSQKALVVVIPRGEELQHFFFPVLSHLSAEEEEKKRRIRAAAPCSPAEDGMISPLYPSACDLPSSPVSLCGSLKKTQEVCRNVHPQFFFSSAARGPQDSAQTTATERAAMPHVERQPACLHACMHAS